MPKEITEQEYRTLKSSVEAAKSEADKAQGALDTLMKRLKDEFGCKDLKAAEAKLGELQEDRDKAQKDFDTKFAAYEKEWAPDGD